MNYSVVYKITNQKTNKIYIGKTYYFGLRMRAHLSNPQSNKLYLDIQRSPHDFVVKKIYLTNNYFVLR